MGALCRAAGDEVIVIAEDDNTYRPLQERPELHADTTCPEWHNLQHPEKVLFCGWRRDMDDMIAVLDAFVSPGSELWLYNEVGLNCL